MKISFLIPVKNEEKFIYECLNSIKKYVIDYEIIVVNDHSTDNTVDKILKFINESDNNNIYLYNNKGNGKLNALNLAFSKSTGNFIKLIGGDDVLGKDFKDIELDTNTTYCHDVIVTDENLNKKFIIKTTADFLNSSFEESIYNLKSIGSGNWIIPRSVAKKIFPIPIELIFEDVWISNMIKRYSKIMKIEGELYFYRQNDDQTYGVYNMSKEKIEYLYSRNCEMLKGLLNNLERFSFDFNISRFSSTREYFILLSEKKISIIKILKSKNITNLMKIKIILLKKFTKLYPFILRVWYLLKR
ncbi:glycosyltransferase family 2 protein [Petrotoga sp. DB-2]